MLFTFICFGFVCIGFGAVITLCVQGGMATGRLVQHGRNLQEACAETAEYKALAEQLAAKLASEADEYETRYANMARAYDREVLKNHTIEGRRAEAWRTANAVLRELHTDPDPKCTVCGDSVGQVPDTCFVCGLHEETVTHRPHAQA